MCFIRTNMNRNIWVYIFYTVQQNNIFTSDSVISFNPNSKQKLSREINIISDH